MKGRVEGNYVDSHGQSEVGFGLTRLLGFDLLPRIKRINTVKLYRRAVGEPDAYPRLQPALTRPIRWDMIAEKYDQMIKYATAIRSGTASTEPSCAGSPRPTRFTPPTKPYRPAVGLVGFFSQGRLLAPHLLS